MLMIFKKTFLTMSQRYFLRYVVLAVVIAGLGFAVLLGGVTAALKMTKMVAWQWLEHVLDALIGASTLGLTWLLFPLMIPLLGAFLSDAVASRLEREEYGVTDTPSLPLWPQVRGALWFMFTSVLWNVLALIFLIFPPLWLVVYYVLNGWLLGRDFFETVAVRHLLPEDATALRWRLKGQILSVGMGLVLLSQLPVVNLCVPFVAVAVMVHVFWVARQS